LCSSPCPNAAANRDSDAVAVERRRLFVGRTGAESGGAATLEPVVGLDVREREGRVGASVRVGRAAGAEVVESRGGRGGAEAAAGEAA